MLNIFDNYFQESQDLHQSLKVAGYKHPTVVLTPSGFLPDDVINPFTYYLDWEKTGKARYFNAIDVPEYWEISGNNNSGAVHVYSEKRADIVYAEPKHLRLVDHVNWLDKSGKIRSQDHYNQFGQRYAQTDYDTDGQATLTTYFNQGKQERLIENHKTGDIILLDKGVIRNFKTRLEFFLQFLEDSSLDLDHIIFNSLSMPFFISSHLDKPGQDILFWQEPLGDQIPGNMQSILDDKGRCQTIVIPDKPTFEKAKQLLPAEKHGMLSNMGYIYQFKKENYIRPDALILTNSDQIEQVETFIQTLPQITFRIGAITEMSPKLMSLMKYENVILYQNITVERIKEVLNTSDIYLDINYSNEIVSAVREAFLHNHLILAYQETVHDRRYIPREHIFFKEQTPQMVQLLKSVTSDIKSMEQHLILQGRHANYMSAEHFKADFSKILK